MTDISQDTALEKEIYKVTFPGYEEEGSSVKPDIMIVESNSEMAVMRMVMSHIGIDLSAASARDVMEQYESGGSVVSIDDQGKVEIKKRN